MPVCSGPWSSIQYVERVVKRDKGFMDQLIIADIEKKNIASRKAFQSQCFVESDASKIEMMTADGWEPYQPVPADDGFCVGDEAGKLNKRTLRARFLCSLPHRPSHPPPSHTSTCGSPRWRSR